MSAMTGLTTGTVTGVIDRREGAGFVQRERDASDRRKVLVTPVADGVARLQAEYAEHGAHTLALLARRDAADLRVIAEFLADLNSSPGG
jgi:DNA-binding MarR family transcriptional regulator